MRRLRRAGRTACLLALALLPATGALAQDESIALADDPFEITDPLAAAPGEVELALVGIHERARRGRVRGTSALETELEIGVAPRLELRIGQLGAHGNLETRRRLDTSTGTDEPTRAAWGGATRIGALYQLTDGRGGLPVIGVLGRVRRVYGPGRPGDEVEAVALIGQTLGGARRPLGLHLNLGWTARLDPLPGERPSRAFVNASIGQAISTDTALVLTYVREQQERGERDYNLLQAGLRHRLPGGRSVIGLAAGAGLGRDSPAFQLAVAVQWSLASGGW